MTARIALFLGGVAVVFSMFATPMVLHAATCVGDNPCSACSNCKYCKRCAKDGKTCGTCRRVAEAQHQN
jgi:hypothetical protein